MNDIVGQDVDALVLWFVVLRDGAESGVVMLVLVLDVMHSVVDGRGGADESGNGNGQDDGNDGGDKSGGNGSGHRVGGLLENEEGVDVRHSEVGLIVITVAAVVSVGSAGRVVAAASLGVNGIGVEDAGGIDGVGGVDEAAAAAIVAATAAGIGIVYVETWGRRGVIAI